MRFEYSQCIYNKTKILVFLIIFNANFEIDNNYIETCSLFDINPIFN